MTIPQLGQRVRWAGEVGTVIESRIPPAMRIGDALRLVGECSVTILFADGTKAPREVTVTESHWDQLEILDDAAE